MKRVDVLKSFWKNLFCGPIIVVSTNGWFMIAYGLREEIYINNNISRPFSNNTIIIHNNLQRLSSFIPPSLLINSAVWTRHISPDKSWAWSHDHLFFTNKKYLPHAKCSLFLPNQKVSPLLNTTPAAEWLTYGVTVFCELLFMISCQHQDDSKLQMC